MRLRHEQEAWSIIGDPATKSSLRVVERKVFRRISECDHVLPAPPYVQSRTLPLSQSGCAVIPLQNCRSGQWLRSFSPLHRCYHISSLLALKPPFAHCRSSHNSILAQVRIPTTTDHLFVTMQVPLIRLQCGECHILYSYKKDSNTF